MSEDLSYIRERVLSRSEFRVDIPKIDGRVFQPMLILKCFDIEYSMNIKKDSDSGLYTTIYTQPKDSNLNLRDILVNNFMGSSYLERFIKLDNRERNLDILI